VIYIIYHSSVCLSIHHTQKTFACIITLTKPLTRFPISGIMTLWCKHNGVKRLYQVLQHGYWLTKEDVGLDYLISNVKFKALYQIKFELSTNEFTNHLTDFIAKFNLEDNVIETIKEITRKWYNIYITEGVLSEGSTSLKKELRKVYQEQVDETLKRFDRFFEAILSAFYEAYGIYTVVFYEPRAIKENKSFAYDRKSCYITTNPEYFDVINQLNAYYVMIYKDVEPITRLWCVLGENDAIAFFNEYGHRFRDITKFFSSSDDLVQIKHIDLENRIGVYVNESRVIVKANMNLDDLVHDVKCPACKTQTKSNKLVWNEHCKELMCQTCFDKTVFENSMGLSLYLEPFQCYPEPK